jgi:hypothetical protein
MRGTRWLSRAAQLAATIAAGGCFAIDWSYREGAGGSAGGGACACVEEAPAGWSGPFHVLASTGGEGAPTCAGGAAPRDMIADEPPTASCSACACAASAPCAPPQVTCYSDESCSAGPVDVSALVADGACHALEPDYGSCDFAAPALGGCAPSGGALQMAFDGEVRAVCDALSDGACPSGEVCAAPIAPGARLCVGRDGDAACPGGWPVLVSGHRIPAGGPSCTPCTCGALTGVSCADSFYAYSTQDCSGNGLSLDGVGCVATGSFFDIAVKLTQPQGGSCDPAGGELTGSVGPGEPVTLCCKS